MHIKCHQICDKMYLLENLSVLFSTLHILERFLETLKREQAHSGIVSAHAQGDILQTWASWVRGNVHNANHARHSSTMDCKIRSCATFENYAGNCSNMVCKVGSNMHNMRKICWTFCNFGLPGKTQHAQNVQIMRHSTNMDCHPGTARNLRSNFRIQTVRGCVNCFPPGEFELLNNSFYIHMCTCVSI